VLPGKILQELVENARVIGGVNQVSAEAGRDLYTMFVRGEILLSDSTTAEMVKLMENTSRDVNIAIANEFSRLAESFGIDVWEAIDLANRHPRINILRPGPGVGGHCISVDPWFLVEAAPEISTLIQEARRVNDGQPAHVVELLSRALGPLQGIKIAALGLSYKPNVDDMRESPAIAVVQKLLGAGAEVSYFEPYAPEAQIEGATGCGSIEDAVRDAMATILLVNHTEFEDVDPDSVRKIMTGRTILDTRGTWDRGEWTKAGFQFIALGVGEKKAPSSS
jgi:UDP-N-acetyl-D-mannosaminuronic acid dehydrogenase